MAASTSGGRGGAALSAPASSQSRAKASWLAARLRGVSASAARRPSSAAAAGQTEYAHSVDAELGLYLLNHKRERLSLMEKEFHIRLDIRIEGISSAPAAPAQQQGHQHNGQNNGR